MKRIFERIRKFWKREKDDIKKNYIISVGVQDFDSKMIEHVFDEDLE